MRAAGLLLLMVLGRGAEAPVPLDEGGGTVIEVRNALAALARGTVAPLMALPPERWHSPPGLPDPQDPTLFRRWTDFLPVALSHLDAGTRANLLIDMSSTKTIPLAWDRGDLLPGVAGGGEPLRRAAAARLLGWSEPAEPPLGLPGVAVPSGANLQEFPTLFHRLGGRLLGSDGLGATVWQRPLEQHAQVFLGGPWTAIRGLGGITVVATDGRQISLPAVPPQAELVGVVGAGVWFAAKTTVWGYDPASGQRITGILGDEPLGPPLARGLTSWWLTVQAIVVVGPGGVIPVEHGLRLSSLARLVMLREGPGIVDGPRCWRLAPPGVFVGPGPQIEATLPPGIWFSDDDPPWRAPSAWWHRRRAGAVPPTAEGLRRADGSWRSGDWTFTCTSDGGNTTVLVLDAAGEVWRRAWPAPGLAQAPGRSFVLSNGLVFVTEGDRATILDANTGHRWAAVQAPGLDPLACAALPNGLVAWSVGLGERIRWAQGEQRGEIQLAAPVAGWHRAGGILWVRTTDGLEIPIP